MLCINPNLKPNGIKIDTTIKHIPRLNNDQHKSKIAAEIPRRTIFKANVIKDPLAYIVKIFVNVPNNKTMGIQQKIEAVPSAQCSRNNKILNGGYFDANSKNTWIDALSLRNWHYHVLSQYAR